MRRFYKNNRKAILEFYEKKKDVRTYDEPVDKEKAGRNNHFQSIDFVQNNQPPQVPQQPNEHHKTSGYVVNEDQYHQFQHQVHMGHHEDMNMPIQTMM